MIDVVILDWDMSSRYHLFIISVKTATIPAFPKFFLRHHKKFRKIRGRRDPDEPLLPAMAASPTTTNTTFFAGSGDISIDVRNNGNKFYVSLATSMGFPHGIVNGTVSGTTITFNSVMYSFTTTYGYNGYTRIALDNQNNIWAVAQTFTYPNYYLEIWKFTASSATWSQISILGAPTSNAQKGILVPAGTTPGSRMTVVYWNDSTSSPPELTVLRQVHNERRIDLVINLFHVNCHPVFNGRCGNRQCSQSCG